MLANVQVIQDTLSHWEPMEIVTHGAGDTVKLPFAELGSNEVLVLRYNTSLLF